MGDQNFAPPGSGPFAQATGAANERVWTVHDQGRQFGPHTEVELATLLAAGNISSTALVWRAGSPRWIPVTAVVPMPVQPPYTTAVPQPAPYAQDSGKKIAAGVCGILLGYLGVHKFILGYTAAGVIMLLVSLLTFGVGAFVMWVIGIIEGIIYLSKSDAQFYQDYVIHRRQWF